MLVKWYCNIHYGQCPMCLVPSTILSRDRIVETAIMVYEVLGVGPRGVARIGPTYLRLNTT